MCGFVRDLLMGASLSEPGRSDAMVLTFEVLDPGGAVVACVSATGFSRLR